MADQRSVMKEYRALEEKRLSQGLLPEEARRHADLADLLGTEVAKPRSGFDVNAAAAKLRESLLPAGLRNRPPPTPEVVLPEAILEVSPEPEPDQIAAEPSPAYEEAPFTPLDLTPLENEDFFDPTSLGSETGAGANGAPDALPEPEPESDQEAPLPDLAQPTGSAPEDTLDFSAQPGEVEGALPLENFLEPADGTWDPGSQLQLEEVPSLEVADPSFALSETPETQPVAESEQGEGVALAPPADNPASDSVGTSEGAFDPSTLDPDFTSAAPEASAEADPVGEDSTVDAVFSSNDLSPVDGEALSPDFQELPFLDVSQSVLEPIELDADFGPPPGPTEPSEGWPVGEPTAAPEGPDPTAFVDSLDGADPSALPEPPPSPEDGVASEPSDWEAGLAPAESAAPLEMGEYDGPGPSSFSPTADPESEPSLPFDAAAASATDPQNLPEGFVGVPGEYDENSGFAVNGFEAPPTYHLSDGADAGGPSVWQPDHALDRGFELASGGSFGASADAGTPRWAVSDSPSAPWEVAGQASTATSEPDSFAAGQEGPASAESSVEENDDFLAVPAPPLSLGGPMAAPFSRPEPVTAPSPAFVPAPNYPAPATLLTEGTEARIPSPLRSETAKIQPKDPEGPRAVMEQPTAPFTEPPSVPKSVPPPRPPPFPSPPVFLAPPEEPISPLPEEITFEEPSESDLLLVPGTHRVVVHTVEGLVRRGILNDADLASPLLDLAPQPGTVPEKMERERVKAIFFMLDPGEVPPRPQGKRVRVAFNDGRQVAGMSPNYSDGAVGFFLIPADTRTNTGRIFIYRAAVKQVTVD